MSICFELRESSVVMGISTGVHVHLCVRVRYACVQYLYRAWAWAAYSLLDRVYVRVNTGACLLHFACVRAVRCSAWIVRAVVYVECVCVCVR